MASPRLAAPRRGPVTAAERSFAPDLARGAMLLLIALANSPLYLYGRPVGRRSHLAESGVLDRVVTFLIGTFVDGRAYPLFAFLLGYGIVRLADRQVAAGATITDVGAVLRRRHIALVGFGFLHALLLFSGDILGTYGLAGLVVFTLLGASDRRLLALTAALLVPVIALGTGYGLAPLPGDTGYPGMAVADPVGALLARMANWLPATPISVLATLAPIVLGVWAARRRLLDEPERHLPVLRRTAVVGIAVAVLGGLPLALVMAGVWTSTSFAGDLTLGALHTLTGLAGGVGFAAAISLFAGDFRRRRIGAALAACGQRSLSCYLVQSVVFVAVLAPYAGGLGGRLGSAGVAVVAVATWVASVVVADVFQRHGWRGPAEVALRRLTYRRQPR